MTSALLLNAAPRKKPPIPPPPENWRRMELLSVTDVAGVLRCSRPHIFAQIKRGRLAAIHFGDRALVKTASLIRLVDQDEPWTPTLQGAALQRHEAAETAKAEAAMAKAAMAKAASSRGQAKAEHGKAKAKPVKAEPTTTESVKTKPGRKRSKP